MAHQPARSRRPSTRSRRRLGLGLLFGAIVAVLALGAIVPAFAEDPPGNGTEETAETAAPPDTTAAPDTTPDTTPSDKPPAPPESPPAPDDPPPDTQSKQDLPREQTTNASVFSAELPDVQASTNLNIPLNNDTADPGTDCPADGKTYWHFVISPNNNHSAFVTFHLNLGDGIHDISTWVPNGTQNDNVFVEVPGGYTLTDLDKTSSAADISWDGVGNQPDKFQLSHTCPGTPQTGSLTVSKSVVGTPPGGTTFTVVVDCNDGGSHDQTLTFNASGTLTGGTLPITGIPAGTQCTVTETGTGSASSVTYSPGGASPPTVTIVANQQSSVTVTNTYNDPETGSLLVQKVTEGEVPTGVAWKVTVTCTAPSFSDVLDFGPNDLGPKAVTGIPLDNGSNSCSVAETDQGSPPPTLVTVTPNSAQSVTSSTTPLFTVLNSYPGSEIVGSVSVTKAVTGDGSPSNGVQFTVHVSCTDGTEADLVFGRNGGTQKVSGIKIDQNNGTNCTVTEPDTGQASAISFSPDDNGKFTLTVNSPTHDITVTNRFDGVEVGGVSVIRIGGVDVPSAVKGTLPFTGSFTEMLLKTAALLLAVGGAALLIARHRRRKLPA